MQAKYLIQVYTNNPMLAANPSGFFTINGTMTKTKALQEMEEFKQASKESRPLRVISQKDFKAETIAYNRGAFQASKG